MKIRVKSESVITEQRRGENGPYEVFYQDAFFEGAEEVLKVRVPVESPSRGYGVGEYSIASSSFVRNRYQSLELGRLVLEPVAKAKAV